MDRRTLIKAAGATGLLGAGMSTLAASPATAAPGGMPTYRYLRDALKMPLRYNPTGEFIFPCIRGVSDKISGARSRFYLYYAPHEPPGGICVAFSDSLNGPFTEYTANPLIDNNIRGMVVSHVSSPHVIWDAPTKQFFCYFHGENVVTRVARSTDGIHFTDETPILSTNKIPGSTETSYARVFEHTITGRGNKYVMIFMVVKGGRRSLYHGWSNTGWNDWTFSTTPLISPGPDGVQDISAGSLVKRNNTCYIAYHGNDGKMRLTEVGNGFDKENHLGVFYTPIPTDNGRAAAPSFGSMDGTQYMFYEAGPRLGSRICIARAV